MEKIVHTYCRICEPNCGLKATVVDGKLVKLAGDKEHPISKGYICPRGLATLDIHQDLDRISHPQKKVGDGFEQVSWKDALGDIGKKLKHIRDTYGKHSVALYIGNPLAFDYGFSIYMPVLTKTLGSRNVYSAGSQDCNNKIAGSQVLFGSPMFHPVPDIDNIDFLIIWGANPVISKMTLVSLARPEERLKAIEKRGGRVVIIDPRRTETAGMMGEHVFIRPDSDIFLMLAMLNVIFSENLHDAAFVNEHAKNMDQLKDLAAQYPPERAAGVTGIDKDVIITLARDFAKAKNAGIYCSLGVNLGTHGTLGYWLVQCLNAATGRLDRKGSMFFCDPIVDFARMGQKGKKSEGKKSGGTKPPRPKRLSRIGGFTHVSGNYPAGILADEILTPGKDQIKALIVISGNPMLTVPDPTRLEEAFKSLDLLVSLDLFVNETGGMSDYVLPCKDFYEHWDFGLAVSMFNPIRYINYTDKVVDAKGERRDLWVILHQIMQSAGYPFMGNKKFGKVAGLLDGTGRALHFSAPLSYRPKLILKILLRMGGVSWRKLKNSHQGLLLPPHKVGRFFSHRILTADKKFDFAPEQFMAEADAIARHFDAESSYQGFKLINQRQKRTHNSWFHNVESFSSKMKTNYVSINASDAEELGIAQDDLVEVITPTSTIKLPANIVTTLMPGVICIPHGWGHDKPSGLSKARQYPGVNVNTLMASGPDALEKFAGMAKLTGVNVEVRKAV